MVKHVMVNSSSGGFILADNETVLHYNAAIAKAVNVLFDPDGKTCATLHGKYDVWDEALDEARRTINKAVGSRLAMVLAEVGCICLSIQDQPLVDRLRRRVRETFRLSLSIPSGSVALGDGLFLFDEEDEGREFNVVEEIVVEPGSYDVLIYSLLPDPEVVPTLGWFGDEDSPAIVVQLTRAENPQDRPIDIRVDMSDWAMAPAPGTLCVAEVTTIVKGEAFADMRRSRNYSAGEATFLVPVGVTLNVGDECWLLLERKQGKHWVASLVE